MSATTPAISRPGPRTSSRPRASRRKGSAPLRAAGRGLHRASGLHEGEVRRGEVQVLELREADVGQAGEGRGGAVLLDAGDDAGIEGRAVEEDDVAGAFAVQGREGLGIGGEALVGGHDDALAVRAGRGTAVEAVHHTADRAVAVVDEIRADPVMAEADGV